VRTVSIVAGGWSFREVNHHKVPGEVIAINDAFTYLHEEVAISAIVSMDRLWTENRWGDMATLQHDAYLRRSTLKNVGLRSATWLHPYENGNDGRVLSDMQHPLTLNGQNSGACGVNLGYQWRPKQLFLFGFDMCLSPEGDAHWHPPYPWGKGKQGNTGAGSYSNWASHFATYAKQFEAVGTKVYNVSIHSLITAFERISAQELGVAK
jgi:hypothetical protein